MREKYVQQYPQHTNANFNHATELPEEIKTDVKSDMLNAIINDKYGFIPVVFSQINKVFIQDSTTTYIMFLVDGLVKLIQDCSFQKDFHLTVMLGGRRDIAREEEYSKKNDKNSEKKFYITEKDIKAEFNKYMAMAQIRAQYSFKNNFSIIFKMGNDHENELLVLGDYISNSFLTLRNSNGEWKKQHRNFAKKIHVYQIAEEPNIERIKRYMADGNYSMALFYAMGTDKDTNEYKTFRENFKFAIRNMPTAEKELVLAHYGQLLKRLLEVDRNINEVINQIDKTMAFIGGDKESLGECQNEFVANLQLYKMTAVTHLGKVGQFKQIANEKCLPNIKDSGNLELYIIYINRKIVHCQDTFQYEESLKLGGEIIDLLDEILKPLNKFNEYNNYNFKIYNDQYFRLCGSLALTCYFTLNQNKSARRLELARNCSEIAINGFTRTADKRRQYQIRAQIEAEAGNFETACEMLDKGLNIQINALQAEQFKNFSAFDWYHFAKFAERLLSSKDEKYFQIAKNAVETAKKEFRNYRKKINTAPEYPDYVTFNKMGLCFDILKDFSLASTLHEEALRGVDAEISSNKNGTTISVNANAAAFRLVMMASNLLTLERNNQFDKAPKLILEIKNYLAEYLNQVKINSMKVPFEYWQEALETIEKNPADKINIIEGMSRVILL